MTLAARPVRVRILAAFLASGIGGCVLPIPEQARTLEGQRGNLGDQVPAFIVEGRTTREEVLLNLGEPDRRADEDRWLAYDTARRLRGVTWVGLAAGYASSGGGVLGTYQTIAWRELELRFDAQGIVSKAEFVERVDRGFSLFDDSPYPPGRRALTLTPAVQAYRDAMQSFVPAEPDEHLLEAFIAAACHVQGQWHEALIFVTDRAVYCQASAPAGGAARAVLLRWGAGEIDPPDWAAQEAAPDRPAVHLQRRDGTTALFAFHPIDGPATDFDRRRAELFLDSLRQLQSTARR